MKKLILAPFSILLIVISLRKEHKAAEMCYHLFSEVYRGLLFLKLYSDSRRKRLVSMGLEVLQIERLHAPVGLPIGSYTPPEIALSIMAEITAPLNDILTEAESLIEDYIGHDDLRHRIRAISENAVRIRQNIKDVTLRQFGTGVSNLNDVAAKVKEDLGFTLGSTITLVETGRTLEVVGFTDSRQYSVLPTGYTPTSEWDAIFFATNDAGFHFQNDLILGTQLQQFLTLRDVLIQRQF